MHDIDIVHVLAMDTVRENCSGVVKEAKTL